MFNDGAGTKYDSTLAKFLDVPFGTTWNGTTASAVIPYTPFAFTAANFPQKADNSVAGEMRDCGECHVGGGMMEYIPSGYATPTTAFDAVVYSPSNRISLRDAQFNGTQFPAVTAFNYFIDIFGADGDPSKTGAAQPTFAAVANDFSQTGVLEMDCLMCHLVDYSWEKRKEAVRKGEFDASRAVGAGLATATDGTSVVYDAAAVATDSSGHLKLASSVAARITGKPDSTNCASCHLSQYNVDWKKRGDMWLPGKDVHTSIGCLGCHERIGGTVGTNGMAGSTDLGLCDPAKGGASPYDAMWNKLDGQQFKDCAGCHSGTTPSYLAYGAPNPDATHALYGLTAKNAFKADGTAASHLDIIDCTACHIRKSGFTGGAFVDGSGADAEGRVALHDEPQVGKDMDNGVALHWANGKLYAGNLLTSFFWRDVNGLKFANGGLDINNDGREAGMDPLLQTHVAKINAAADVVNPGGGLFPVLKALTMERNADNSWINSAEIDVQKAKLAAAIRAELGSATTQTTNAFLPKLSFLLVPFKQSHNIVPAMQAWGAKGCKECHAANAGFYNGAYPVNGNMAKVEAVTGTRMVVDGAAKTDFTFRSDQVTPFTKVNGLMDVTDSHPNVVTKKGDRTVPVVLLSRFDTPYSAGTAGTDYNVDGQYLKDVDRSELLYEATFQTRNTAWSTTITGAKRPAACLSTSPFYCANPAGGAVKRGATSTLGWLLKVEVDTNGDGVAETTRTVSVTSDIVGSVDDLITNLGQFGGDYFSILGVDTDDDTVNDALRIVASGSNKVRISPQSDAGPLGFGGSLWKADPIVRGTNTYAGRAAYLSYLNSIDGVLAKIERIGDNPKNASIPLTVVLGSEYTLTGSALGTGTYTYTWSFSDNSSDLVGQSVAKTFTHTGVYTVTLTVTDSVTSETKQDTQSVMVVAGVVSKPTVQIASDSSMTTDLAVSNIPPNAKKIKVDFGDGSSAFFNVPAAPETVTHVQHAFRRNAVNHVGTKYKYSVVVRAYDIRYAVISKSDPAAISLNERTDYGVTTAFSLRYNKTPASYLYDKDNNPAHLRDYTNHEFYYTATGQRTFNYNIKVRNYGDSTADTTVTIPNLGGLTGGKVSVIMPAGVTVTGINADGLYHAGDAYTIHNLQKNKIGTITIRVTVPDANVSGTMYTPPDVTLTSDDNAANNTTAIVTSDPKVVVQRPFVKAN